MHEQGFGPQILQNLYHPEVGAGYIFLANLVGNACLFYWLKAAFKAYRWTWDWVEMKSLWIYAYPIMFMSLAAMFNLMFDRLLLEEFLPTGFYPGRSSQDALGIYGNCYKLSVFMSLAIQAFKYAAEPLFLGRTSADNTRKNLALVTHWFVIVCSVLWVGVSVNLFWIKELFLRKAIYWEGISIVPVLLLANLFLGVYYTQSVWFKKTNKTYMGSVITLIGLVLTITGNILFIPIYGYMACAWSFLFSSFVMMILCYLGGQKYDPTPYRMGAGFVYILVGIGCIWVGPYLAKSLQWNAFLMENVGLMFLLAYIAMKEFSWKKGRPQMIEK
jgi:O-antigen/teichoic acid export membrane protein